MAARRDFLPVDKYKGHEYERDLIYGIEVRDPKYLKDYRDLFFAWQAKQGQNEAKAHKLGQENIKKIGLIYLPQTPAIMLVKKNQPWPDATNPSKSLFGNVLRNAIIEELDIEDEAKMDQIKFYTATSRGKKPKAAYNNEQDLASDHTPLDWFHGIDCFIEIGGDDKKNGVIIPLDVTLNRQKRNPKAIVVPEIDIPEKGELTEAFTDAVYDIAQKVINEIPSDVKKWLTSNQKTA
jgi:hypothetical protein